MRFVAILFFLSANLFDLFLVIFTAVPQYFVVGIFLISFIPYLMSIRATRGVGELEVLAGRANEIVIVSNRASDLEAFDLEYSELTGCVMSPDRSEIELILCCAVKGWHWRSVVDKLFRKIGLYQHVLPSPVEFDVSLRMIDVSSPKGLVSEWNPGPQAQLFEQGANDIADFRAINLLNGRFRLFLEIDNGTIEFEYAECIQRQKGRQSPLNS